MAKQTASVSNLAKCRQCSVQTDLGGYTWVSGKIIRYTFCGDCREHNRIRGGGIPKRTRKLMLRSC